MLQLLRACFNISSAGWPNRECQSSVVEFEDEELLKLENKQSVEELKLVGNLFSPRSRWPLRRTFLVTYSLTITRLVARWGAWRTLFNWNTLEGDWKILVPVWRMGSCVPFLIVTLSLPLYDCKLSREMVWERWWVAPVSKNRSSLFMLAGDAIMAWAWFWLLLVAWVLVSELLFTPWKFILKRW